MTFLGGTGATSYQRISINNITNYKYLVLNCCVDGQQRVQASTVIPVSVATNFLGTNYSCSASGGDVTNYEAMIYFSSNTVCYMKSKSAYDYAALYGVS